MDIKCRNCGATIADGVTICPYCDSEITFETKADNSGAASQDTSGISFSFIIDEDTDESVDVNNVQTVKIYVEKMTSGKEEFATLEASSPIHGIKYMQAWIHEDELTKEKYIIINIRKNDENFLKKCDFQECLNNFIDFYEGRFNPDFISFELSFGLFGSSDDESIAVHDVQTIKHYATRIGKEEVLYLKASSPIYGIKWLSSFMDEYFNVSVSFCKDNVICKMNKNYCVADTLDFYADFYEGRFNPNSDEYSELYKVDGEEFAAEKLFQINYQAHSIARKKTLMAMCNFMNSSDERTKYMHFLEEYAKNALYMATSDVKSDLFKKACALTSAKLATNETPIFWKDDAIFKCGKIGVMLTDKRLFFVKKKNILELSLKDIKSIKPDHLNADSVWCFNDNENYAISVAGSRDDSLKALGVLLAFICSMARDLNGEGYKIKIDCEK